MHVETDHISESMKCWASTTFSESPRSFSASSLIPRESRPSQLLVRKESRPRQRDCCGCVRNTAKYLQRFKSIADELYIDDFHLWQREDVEWDPLCTHLSSNEGVAQNIHLSDEELERLAFHRINRKRLWRQKRREEDEELYLLEGLLQHQAWSAANPGRVNEIAADVRKKAKDQARFRCDLCDHNAATQYAHDAHLDAAAHLEAVQQGSKVVKTPSAEALKRRTQRAAAKASKRYSCAPCNKNYQGLDKLNKHCKTDEDKEKCECRSDTSQKTSTGPPARIVQSHELTRPKE